MPGKCDPLNGRGSPDLRSHKQANKPQPASTGPSGPFVRVANAAIIQNHVQPRPSIQARKASKAAAVTVKAKTPSVRARPNSLTPAVVIMQASAPNRPARDPKYFRPKVRMSQAVPNAANAP